MRRQFLVLVTIALGCGDADNDEQRERQVQGDTMRLGALSDAQVASLLRYIDGAEIATAQQLLPKLASAPARDFARLLIDDHTRARDRLRQLTDASDSSAPSPGFHILREHNHAQSGMYVILPGGAAFDATFLGTQAGNHAMIVDSLHAWRNQVESDELRRAIDAVIPVVESHRERALAAFRTVSGLDADPLRPGQLRADSSGPQHVTPDSSARAVRDR